MMNNVIVDATPDYDLYEALLDYKSGDEKYAADRKAVFKIMVFLKMVH
jgi:hypothetical protein